MSQQVSALTETDSVYDSCNSGHSSFHSLASFEPLLQHAASSPQTAHQPSDRLTGSHIPDSVRSPSIGERAASERALDTDLPFCSDSDTACAPPDSPFLQPVPQKRHMPMQATLQTHATAQHSAEDSPALRIQFGTLDSGIRALRKPTEGLSAPVAPEHGPSKAPTALDSRSASGSDGDGAALTRAPLTPEQSRERRAESLVAQRELGIPDEDVLACKLPVKEPFLEESVNGDIEHAQHELLPPASAFSATPAASSPTYRCDDCGIFTTSPDLLTGHLRGRKHHKRLAAAAASGIVLPAAGSVPHATDSLLSASSAGRPMDGDTYCDVCEVITTSKDQLASHRLGKRHSRQVERLGSTDESATAGGVPPHVHAENESCGDESSAAHARACQLCDVALPDAQHAASHLKGQKHARRARQEALLQDTELAVTDALDSLLDDGGAVPQGGTVPQRGTLAAAPMTQEFALHDLLAAAAAAAAEDDDQDHGLSPSSSSSFPVGYGSDRAAADGGTAGAARSGGEAGGSREAAAAEGSAPPALGDASPDGTPLENGMHDVDESPAAAPSAFAQGPDGDGGEAASAAAGEAARQGEAVAKVVRFGSPENGGMLMETDRVPPASPFPLQVPSEASSSSPMGPVRGSSPPHRPPPPLWRGASGVQPLHGGGSISVAAPHFCPVCGIIATSAANLQDHMRGRRHARRLQYLKHMPDQERSKHIDRIASGDMLLRHGGGCEAAASSDMAAKLSSLNLPSSMDIARYLEQVQFVDLPEASPRKGLRTRLSNRLSTSSILLREAAIPEEGCLEEASTPATEPAAAPPLPAGSAVEGSAEASVATPAPTSAQHELGSGADAGLQEEGQLDEAAEEAAREVHHCAVCSISTTSAAHLEAHLAGRKHRRRAEVAGGRIARRSPHLCRLCDITTTSADHMALHIAGRAHQRRARAEATGGLNGAVPSSSQGSGDLPDEAAKAAMEHVWQGGGTRDDQAGAVQHVPAASRSSFGAAADPAQQQQQLQQAWRGNGWHPDHRSANNHHRGVPSNPNNASWNTSPYPSRPSSANSNRPHAQLPYSNSPVPTAYSQGPHRSHVGPRASPQPHGGMPSPPHLPPYLGFYPSASPYFASPGVMPQQGFVPPGWWGNSPVPHSSPSQPPQSAMLPPLFLPGGVLPAYAPLVAPGGFKEAPLGPSSRGHPHGSPVQLPRGKQPPAAGPAGDAYNCETCQVQVSGIDRLRHHMRSKQHVKRTAASSSS